MTRALVADLTRIEREHRERAERAVAGIDALIADTRAADAAWRRALRRLDTRGRDR